MKSQLIRQIKNNTESTKLMPTLVPDEKLEKTPARKNKSIKLNTYGETFETMLDILVYAVFCGREITWKDIQENVEDKHKTTIIRKLKSLKDLGYLEYGVKSKSIINTFFATEKSKELFGFKQRDN